jgi:hypothetical protein
MRHFTTVLLACAVGLALIDARAADPKATTGNGVTAPIATRPDPCATPKRDTKKPADKNVPAPTTATDRAKPR